VEITDRKYQRLLEFRSELRRFLRWSEAQAEGAGITPAQHQLLLAIRGHSDGNPTVGDVAEHLVLRHHSTVELIDRARRAGFVRRAPDPDDGRVVRLTVTPAGARILARLAASHVEELARLGPRITGLCAGLDVERDSHSA
jgi:DNA-binding MarR family transcriptional regulator